MDNRNVLLTVLEAGVQDKDTSRFSVCWGPTSQTAVFSLSPHMVKGGRDLSRVSLIKGTKLFHKGSTLTTLSHFKDSHLLILFP